MRSQDHSPITAGEPAVVGYTCGFPQSGTVVLCAFRELTNPEPLRNFNPEYAYAYRWALPTPPIVGQWAMVDRYDEPAIVIVGAIGVNSYAKKFGVDSLKAITRLVPTTDIERAQAAIKKKISDERTAETTWLAHCRWVAGLDATQPVDRLSANFDAPSLPMETADAISADRHGSNWWRAYRMAGKLQRSEVEIERFKGIARAWYRIRDTTVLMSVRNIAYSLDFGQVIHDLENGKDLGDPSGNFLGKPMLDWLRYVEELSKAGEPEASKALDLIYALITVAEKEATKSGREPAPAYTERAAILHRKRKEYSKEVAVLQRWENSCPPERRGPGVAQSKLAQRLTKAKELANKHPGHKR